MSGLEQLTAEEVVAAGHRVVDVSKRQLVVELASVDSGTPRLADDLFVVHGAVTDPGRTKDALAAAVRALDVPPAESGAFAVTASFVGARNYNRFDIEDLVGAQLGGRYHSRRHGVSPPAERSEWRVVLDGKTMWLGLRPYAVPLHRRPWRTRTVRGSLHPPVAAAMARLAGIASGHTVLDPFCGAGTLLLEAHALEPQATYVGSDRDPAALAAARENTASAAGIRENAAGAAGVRWRRGDAARLSTNADRIITNPPWDVRLSIGDLTPYIRQWHRALDGRLVAILNPQQAAQLDRGWRVLARYDLAVAGQHPRIVVAEPSRP
ncbi:methyltransferase domain-containing protein [Kribbella kalugense]|uniref:methyltransferase domain-containing protein n=1 Tax=Kribbella kalugense TaxID=2512221 RepID=UPI001416F76E|nr:methyltransferase domain-containing protein [Kribbella kalugense]